MPSPLLVAALTRPFDVAIRVPGSKSLTNRFAVLAALARGTSRIKGALRADDTDRLFAALETLGVRVRREGDETIVDGCDARFPHGGRVDLGDGGTPTRFVIALASLAAAPVVVDGSPRMRERPVEEGIELLRRLGAKIDGERLPVTIHPARLSGGPLDFGQTASSQFLSALLLVGPCCAAPLTLNYRTEPTSASYLDLTVDAMRGFGIHVDEAPRLHRVAPQPIDGRDVTVEADASAAAYFAVAAAIVPGARIELLGIGAKSRQPDVRLLDALASMGATVERGAVSAVVRGPQRLKAIDVDASLFPDASMALAIACARAEGRSVIRGLGTLRVKETDRIAALATELERVGCRCSATGDSLAIEPGPQRSDAVTIETYRDHRMAMSFATLGLGRGGISISDPGCVAKSYPDFWTDVARLSA